MAATAARLPQHLSALERANRVRLRRAELKRGVCSLVDVVQLLSPNHAAGVKRLEPVDPLLASLTVHELLTWAPRWGDNRARRLLEDLGIPERTALGVLTDNRRWRIVAALTGQPNPFAAPVAEPSAPRLTGAELRAARKAFEAQARAARARELAAHPPELRVACPSCAAGVGEACATYEPTTDRWHEPEGGHAARRRAAGLA